jgi:RNA recognition motif-containing protein
MTSRIYIGNLSDEVTAEDLEKLFAAHGKVLNAEVFSGLGGGSDGFAFVQMKTSDAAHRAIEQLNGQQLGGCKLAVTEAKEEEEQVGPVPGGFGDRGGFGGGDYN